MINKKRLRILVRVESIDIRGGYRDCGGACPLSLAIHRAIGCPVDVGDDRIYEYNESFSRKEGPGRRLAVLPPRARQFLADFDAGLKVSPFGFYLWLFRKDVLKGEPAGAAALLRKP